MTKKYFIKEVAEPEMIKCSTCDGTGKIIGTITSDSLESPITNHEIVCPNCSGSGEISSGRVIHYKVGTISIYGNATVEDEDKSGTYILGFVCDDDEKIKQFKEQNNISDFVTYPNALSFYMDREDTILYETYEEAKAVCEEKEKNWKPSEEK